MGESGSTSPNKLPLLTSLCRKDRDRGAADFGLSGISGFLLGDADLFVRNSILGISGFVTLNAEKPLKLLLFLIKSLPSDLFLGLVWYS